MEKEIETTETPTASETAPVTAFDHLLIVDAETDEVVISKRG